MYRLKSSLRTRLWYALKAKQWYKNSEFNTYIGCSKKELELHIESQFKEGMTWDNYGEWEIDHIKPLSIAETENEMYKLCHYTNLQPLWKSANRKKYNKY